MTIARARMILTAIFLAGLIVELLLAAISHSAISQKDLRNAVLTLLSIYSVHLAIIFGSLFAKTPTRRPLVPFSISAFWVAVVLATIWNLLLIGRTVAFAAAVFNPHLEDNINSLLTYLKDVSGASTFLVAGSLAFFFAKD